MLPTSGRACKRLNDARDGWVKLDEVRVCVVFFSAVVASWGFTFHCIARRRFPTLEKDQENDLEKLSSLTGPLAD